MKVSLKSLLALFVSILLILSLISCEWLTDQNDTDEEPIAHNITNPGNAKVGLFSADGNQSVENAIWNDASSNELFTSNSWEPGLIKAYHIKVDVSEASIAVNYRLALVSEDEDPWYANGFDVYYFDSATQISTRADLDDEHKLGTLASVLSGDLTDGAKRLSPGESDIVTIVVKMSEDACNEYQGITVDCSVQLKVSRILPESDSFGDDYDG